MPWSRLAFDRQDTNRDGVITQRTSIAGWRLSKVAGLQQHEPLLRLERAVGQSIIERSELNILANSQRDRRTGKTTVSRVRGRAG